LGIDERELVGGEKSEDRHENNSHPLVYEGKREQETIAKMAAKKKTDFKLQVTLAYPYQNDIVCVLKKRQGRS